MYDLPVIFDSNRVDPTVNGDENHMRKHARAHAYRANSLVIALVGAGAMLYSLSLPIGSFVQPGSGMWPLIVSGLMTFCALLLMFTEKNDDYEPIVLRTVVAAIGFVLLALFIVGFQLIGLTIPSVLLIFIWLRWLAGEPWRLSLLIAIGGSAVFAFVFVILLGVPVPNDPILNLLTGGRF